jgi:hypothetical protein
MENGRYKFHRRAVLGFQQLEADEQAQVTESLAALTRQAAAEWPPAEVKRLSGEPPLYLVPVNDSLRLIVQALGGQQV